MFKALKLSTLFILMLGGCYMYVHEVPPVVESSYSITTSEGKPSIYLTRTIESPSNYTTLVQYINSHKDVKEMNVYLLGDGGSLGSLLLLVNTMKHSPTKFHGIVMGEVSSAHAVLAMNMDTLEVANDEILFLFHRIAQGGRLASEVCSSIPLYKTDRTINMRGKCIRRVEAIESSANNIALSKTFSAMSTEQFKRYMKGDDIVISYKEILINRGTAQ